MEYERLTEKDISICTWDNPKPRVKIKPMPFLMIGGNTYNPQEQVNIRLHYLENEIENGTLVRLPCKVGDRVYVVCYYNNRNSGEIKQKLVSSIVIENHMLIKTDNGLFGYDYWTYNVDCFLTKAEAEARLKELQKGTTKETI